MSLKRIQHTIKESLLTDLSKTHGEWKSVIADRFIRNLKKISDHITIKLKSSNVTSGTFFDYGVEEDFVVKKVKPTVMWTYSITDAND